MQSLLFQQALRESSALSLDLVDGPDDRYANRGDQKKRPYQMCSVHNHDSSQGAAMSNREMTVIGLLMQRGKFFFALGVAGPMCLMVLALIVPAWAQHPVLCLAMAVGPASFVMMLRVVWRIERIKLRFHDRRRRLMASAA